MSKKKLVVLSGAGISAESGISTFRDAEGLWEGHDVMEVASPDGWKNNQDLVLDFYNQRRRQLLTVTPNKGHQVLAALEQDFDVTIITQNVDNLHQQAGSSNVIHLHGELLKVRSTINESLIYDWTKDLITGDKAEDGAQLRPHIVWFGEMPLKMDEIYQRIEQSDLFVSIGTSGVVYPAAGFVHDAKMCGAYTIEINLAPSAVESEFDEKHYGKASEKVPELVKLLLDKSE